MEDLYRQLYKGCNSPEELEEVHQTLGKQLIKMSVHWQTRWSERFAIAVVFFWAGLLVARALIGD